MKAKMKNTRTYSQNVDRRTNVIPVSFKDRRKVSSASDNMENIDNEEEAPHGISHPASKNFPVKLDPLEDLLAELDIAETEYEVDYECQDEVQEDYIFHHQKEWNYSISRDDSPSEIADTVIKQIQRLKEDSKRLKYYLQELNLNQ